MKLHLIKYKHRVGIQFICTGFIWQTVTYYDKMSLFSSTRQLYEHFALPDNCLSVQVKTEKRHFHHNSFQICACAFLSKMCVWGGLWIHVWLN